MASAYRSLVELAKLGNRNLRKARSDGFRMTEVESEILTLEEVAAYLKAGKRTVYRLAQKGAIPAFKLRYLALSPLGAGSLDRREHQQEEARGRVSVRQVNDRIAFGKEQGEGCR